ncbi:hypothetical protein ALC60_12386 [Trachymyrmex zeteki]|uniref:Uncharacterized protein n=1 Tax=Mycetomoellerius zeteki TaxID=64791 RepID=A0A151WL80_9HYME|nr:hypothetical protein ALC60_12386 [Trachymyrmex zeteki]
MDTRSKKLANDPSTETHDAKARELATREFELQQIERGLQERERRMRQQEVANEQRGTAVEHDRRNLDRERYQMISKVSELEIREKEVEKRWQDFETTRLEESAANIPRETKQPRNFRPHPARSNNSYDEIPSPKVSFKEATDSVPHFDGYNIPLAQFTRACRRARDIIPAPGERNLTKLLINKLSNRAYYAVEDEPCNSVTDLRDLLTDATFTFGTAKTQDQYRGELSIIYLKPGEHILDYISRVKDLRNAILDAERREHGELDSHFLADIDNLTTRSFYEGLSLEYRLQVSPLTHPRHTDMFAAAKAIAKRQELDKQRLETRPRYDREKETRLLNPIERPLAHSTPHKTNPLDRYNYPREIPERRDYRYDVRNREPPRNTPHNYYPPRYEPRRDAPPTNNYAERFYGNRDNRRNEFNRNYDKRTNDRVELPVCKYCKNPGHTIDECRKRQRNNSQQERSGNLSGPSGHRSQNPTDEKKNVRPIRIVETEEKEIERPTEPESQS